MIYRFLKKTLGLLRRIARRLTREIHCFFRRGNVKYRGMILPIASMRWEMCGREYASDKYFLESGCAEARRVVSKMGFTRTQRIVEIGSGLGRFATGLLHEVGEVEYWGFDTARTWVQWCQRHIEKNHPTFRFIHIDVENELYNPTGAVAGEAFRFPLPDAHADIVYMWGVFTNMRLKDARNYVAEMSRMTRDGGRIFLTAFVEENVPEETVNPVGYVDYTCECPLHVVRYEQSALFEIFKRYSLTIENFSHHGGCHCNQSEIYLHKDCSLGLRRIKGTGAYTG